MTTRYHCQPTRQRTRREPNSLSAPRPPVRAAASRAAMAGIQVHACPTTPKGAPDARGTHTTQVRMKTRRKKVTKGWRRIKLAISLPPKCRAGARFKGHKEQVAVLRPHAASAGHVTKAAYSCLRQGSVRQSTKGAPNFGEIPECELRLNGILRRSLPEKRLPGIYIAP